MANIWGRKPIAVLQAEAKEGEFGSVPGEPRLRRTLSLASLIALGIGCIIGAGIFVLTGNAAAAHAGPAVSLSFVLAGLVSTFAGLCYAEMASTVPVAGSAYTYAYATMGEFVAWVIGWDLILEYAFGATTVAIGWSGYVTSFLRDLGVMIPAEFASAPFAYDPASRSWSPTGALVNLPAILIIVAVTILLVLGIRESAKVNNIIVAIKLAIVVLFILAGVWFVKTSNWVTTSNPTGAFVPPNVGPGQYGWSGIIRGAGWFSLPISASTPYRPPRRKPATRKKTCRSPCSDRSRSAPCSMCWLASSLPASCHSTG
jgi:APA family basic amino acid/polyamine antiporter